MYTTKFNQPLGCRIEIIIEETDVAKAYEILSTKRRYKYTSAVRCGDRAELKRRVWICPYCGSRIPAYPEFFNEYGSYSQVTKSDVAKWANLQCSLFDTAEATIALNNPITDCERICPHCGRRSKPSRKYREITYTEDNNYLAVSAEIVNVSDIILLKWAKDLQLDFNSALYETVVFNFDDGTVCLKLHDASGDMLSVLDVTQKPEAWNSGVVYELLAKSKANQRIFRRLFAKHYGSLLPLPTMSLMPEEYAFLMLHSELFSDFNTVNEAMKPCEIDGFHFSWFYNAISQQQRNNQYPVIAVRNKSGAIVGRIKVDADCHRIIQSYMDVSARMTPSEKALLAAYEKWKLRYGFTTN